MPEGSLLERLRHRKLVQWAIAYLAAAWVVVESSSLIVEQFGWPAVIGQAVTILAAVGFFGALILAWYHGEQGRQRVSGPELLMLAVLFAIAGGVVSLMGRPSASEAVSGPDTATERGATVDLVSHDDRASIAVLPFADMSPDGDQEYFADGVAEEILNAIAKIPGLRVAARTSAFSFKGDDVDIRTVGERLSVGAVLEGSLRREGDQVRITAQLIDVADGFHLWSESYDRDLESVFAVQDEIAREIVRALQIELIGPQSLALEIPTTSSEAYEAYLRALHAIGLATWAGWEEAMDLLTTAIELDPSFAPAHASVAATHLLMAWFGEGTVPETVPVIRAAAARALELDTEVSGAHAVLGYLALYHDWDWPEAGRLFLRALELNPNHSMARHGYGDLLAILGDGEAGLRQVELGRTADPLAPLAVFPVLGHLAFLGRYEAVLREAEEIRALFPDQPEIGSTFVATALWYTGRRREALAEWGKAWPTDPAFHEAVERGFDEAGPEGAMRAWADRRARAWEPGRGDPYGIAVLYGRAGDVDATLEWLERTFEARSPALLHVTMEPAFDGVRAEPEFERLLERMGIPRG